MLTGAEVLVAPRSSMATAVSTCPPARRLTVSAYGEFETIPNETPPLKNWTRAIVPSLSAALAWIGPLQGAANVAPTAGFVIATVGKALTVMLIELVVLAP